MGLIEIRIDGELAAVGELRTDHARSSYGLPVLVLTDGRVRGASAGDALGQGDLGDCELRVRDPQDLGRVREWASALPGATVAVAWGGPRGGGRQPDGRDTVARKITLERGVWGRLEALVPGETTWSKRVERAIELLRKDV